MPTESIPVAGVWRKRAVHVGGGIELISRAKWGAETDGKWVIPDENWCCLKNAKRRCVAGAGVVAGTRESRRDPIGTRGFGGLIAKVGYDISSGIELLVFQDWGHIFKREACGVPSTPATLTVA